MSNGEAPVVPVIQITPEMIQHRVDAKVKEDLAKVNITEQAIALLNDEVTALTAEPIPDQQRYDLVKGMDRKLVSLRRTTEKYCKAGRDEAILEQRTWLKAERGVTEPLKAMEAHTSGRLLEYEQKLAEVRRKEQEAKEAAEKARLNAVFALGFAIIPFTPEVPEEHFALGTTVITRRDILAADEATWTTMLRQAEIVSAEAKEAEALRVADIKRKEEQVKAFEAKQEEQDRREKELNDRMVEMRSKELLALGMKPNDHGQLVLGSVVVDTNITPLHIWTTEGWEEFIGNVQGEKERLDAEQQQIMANRQKSDERRTILFDKGCDLTGDGWSYQWRHLPFIPGQQLCAIPDEEWTSIVQQVDAIIEEKAAALRQAETEALLNGQRCEELIALGMKPREENLLAIGSLAVGGSITVKKDALFGYRDDEYADLCERVRVVQFRIDAHAEADRAAEAKRIADEAVEKERKRVADEDEARKQREKDAEDERLRVAAAASDREKFMAYIIALQQVPAPTFASKVVQHGIARLAQYIKDFANGMLKNDLK